MINQILGARYLFRVRYYKLNVEGWTVCNLKVIPFHLLFHISSFYFHISKSISISEFRWSMFIEGILKWDSLQTMCNSQ